MSQEPNTKLRVKLKTNEGVLSFECFKVPRILQIGQGAVLDNPTRRVLGNIPLNKLLSHREAK